MNSVQEFFSSLTCSCYSNRVRGSSLGKVMKPKKSDARSMLSAKTEGEFTAIIRSVRFDDSCISGRRGSSASALRKPEGRPARPPSRRGVSAAVIADACVSEGTPSFGQAHSRTDKSDEVQAAPPVQAAPAVQVEGGPEVPADLFASLMAAGRAANIRGQHRTELRTVTRSDGRRTTVRTLTRMDIASHASHSVA